MKLVQVMRKNSVPVAQWTNITLISNTKQFLLCIIVIILHIQTRCWQNSNVMNVKPRCSCSCYCGLNSRRMEAISVVSKIAVYAMQNTKSVSITTSKLLTTFRETLVVCTDNCAQYLTIQNVKNFQAFAVETSVIQCQYFVT